MELARRLNQEQGTTVVAVTHFMHEAIHADRVVVMEAGRIALEGSPRAIFAQPARIRGLHLDLPPAAELGLRLHEQCPDFPAGMLTAEEVADALVALLGAGHPSPGAGLPAAERPVATVAVAPLPPLPPHGEQVIAVTELGHFYMADTPLAVRAIGGVNFDVRRGEVLGILGHTGSGKSTAVQHLNGLMRPQEGDVVVFGQSLKTPQLNLRTIRRRVGLVFQFPEAQLFEQFVGDDIAYGPRNLKLSAEEIRDRVRRAMAAVELPFAEFKDRMTFGLSGGQKRRVALAGVLALEPEVLVLDEPTAGLDPQARRHLLERLVALRTQGITLIMISHNMDELAELCDRLVVFAGGATVNHGTPAEIFGRSAALRALGLDVPEVTQVADRLIAAGLLPAGATIYTLAQAEAAIGPLLPQSTNQPIS
jgi:energy-coupling factor transport system ATP-binding protein